MYSFILFISSGTSLKKVIDLQHWNATNLNSTTGEVTNRLSKIKGYEWHVLFDVEQSFEHLTLHLQFSIYLITCKVKLFCKKGILKNFAGKYLCGSLSFNKVYKRKPTSSQLFSCEFCEIFKKIYFEERLWTPGSVSLLYILY